MTRTAKNLCSDYLILFSTYGNRGSTEIFCDRPKGHKGRHSGTASRSIGYDEETEDNVVTETRIYWDDPKDV